MRKLKLFVSALVLSVSSMLGFVAPGLVHAVANTCTWTGATNSTFSTAGNWTNCNSAAPQAGDNIILGTPSAGAGTYHLTNDLGVALGNVTVTATGTSNVTYFVNTLTIAASKSISNAQSNSSIYTSLYIGTDYSAPGILTAQGDLTLSGNSLGVSNATWHVTGTLTVSENLNAYFSPSDQFGGLAVQNGADVAFQAGSNTSPSLTFPITLGGGSATDRPFVDFDAVCSVAGNFSCQTYANTTWAVSGAITLTHDAYFMPDPVQSTVNVTGAISGPGFALQINPAATGTLNINPSSNNSSTTTGSQAPAATTNTITDNVPNSDITVAKNVTTILDGIRGRVEVLNGGLLKGTGTAAASLYVDSGGTVAPGHSPGCMNVTGTFGLQGTYQAEIGGTTPCTGYDQMKVTGVVDLTGGTLSASLYNGFKPVKGQTYTIIDNDGTDAVTGAFANLAEGATFSVGGNVFKISYKGGDGNDVVLTVITAATPDTGFALVKNNPLLSAGAMAVAGGALLTLARRSMKPAARRR